jgi:hypothetical protein
MRAEVRESIDKMYGNVSTLEKLHKSLESQAQSTLVDIRDIKEEIGTNSPVFFFFFCCCLHLAEKNRAHSNEMEEKAKVEIKDIKESIEKLKKKEKEELIEIKSKLANQEYKPVASSSVSGIANLPTNKDKEVCNLIVLRDVDRFYADTASKNTREINGIVIRLTGFTIASLRFFENWQC